MAKKAQAKIRVPNPLEAVKSIGDEFSNTVVNDVAKGGAGDFFKQLLGVDFGSSSHSSEKTINQSTKQLEHLDPTKGAVELFNAKNHGSSESQARKRPSAEKPKPRIEAAIDYHRDIVRSSEKASKVANNELAQRVEQITVELKRLVSSSKVLQMEFASVSVEQKSAEVGEYHVHFLEWMLIVIKNAREKVEDSGAWLGTVKGKNGKKSSGYWEMFKKHGTTFGQSGERSVATQTG